MFSFYNLMSWCFNGLLFRQFGKFPIWCFLKEKNRKQTDFKKNWIPSAEIDLNGIKITARKIRHKTWNGFRFEVLMAYWIKTNTIVKRHETRNDLMFPFFYDLMSWCFNGLLFSAILRIPDMMLFEGEKPKTNRFQEKLITFCRNWIKWNSSLVSIIRLYVFLHNKSLYRKIVSSFVRVYFSLYMFLRNKSSNRKIVSSFSSF